MSSARSVNSNLITMFKLNLTEIDAAFQCNISCKISYTRYANAVFIRKNRE